MHPSMSFLSAPLSSFRTSLLLLAACLAAPVPTFAQSGTAPSAAAPQKPLAYEVVSIELNKSANQGSSWSSRPDGIIMNNVPLSQLVHNGFGIIIDDQISGLPNWVDADRYDIQAKMDEETAADWKKLSPKEKGKQQQAGLLSLLTERCQLKFHRETKQLPVYDLVIAKAGLKMQDAKPMQGSRTMTSNGKFNAQSVTVESLIYSIFGEVGRVLIDKTGLGDKKFDIDLKWTPDDEQGTPDAGPSLYAAIEEQLGLKLVAAKGPVEVIVVDRFERPTAN